MQNMHRIHSFQIILGNLRAKLFEAHRVKILFCFKLTKTKKDHHHHKSVPGPDNAPITGDKLLRIEPGS